MDITLIAFNVKNFFKLLKKGLHFSIGETKVFANAIFMSNLKKRTILKKTIMAPLNFILTCLQNKRVAYSDEIEQLITCCIVKNEFQNTLSLQLELMRLPAAEKFIFLLISSVSELKDKAQLRLLSKPYGPMLIEECITLKFKLCDSVLVKILSLPNAEELVWAYVEAGHPLPEEVQMAAVEFSNAEEIFELYALNNKELEIGTQMKLLEPVPQLVGNLFSAHCLEPRYSRVLKACIKAQYSFSPVFCATLLKMENPDLLKFFITYKAFDAWENEVLFFQTANQELKDLYKELHQLKPQTEAYLQKGCA